MKHFSLKVALKLDMMIIPASYIVGHIGLYGLSQFARDPVGLFSNYTLGAGTLTLAAGQVLYLIELYRRFGQLDRPAHRQPASRYKRQVVGGGTFEQSIPAPGLISRDPGLGGFVRSALGITSSANPPIIAPSGVLPPLSVQDPNGRKVPLDVFEKWFYRAAKYNQRGRGFGEAFWTRAGYPGRTYAWWNPLFFEPCMIVVIDAQLKLGTPILYHNPGNGWTTLVIPANRALAYVYRVQFPARVSHRGNIHDNERGREGVGEGPMLVRA